MMKSAVEVGARLGRIGVGEKPVFSEKLNHRDATETAAEAPEEFAASAGTRIGAMN
jgi:hypothetical protein